MNKVLGVLAVVVLAILGFWLWFAPGGATPADAGTAGARDTRPAKEQAAPRVGGPGIGSAATPSGERVELPVQLAKPKLAVFRGRCIDLRGSPLVGVKVRLHGWESNEERMDEHRKRHGAVDWKDPEAVETGRDGRFEIQFDPPPPYQFALDLTLVGHIEMTGRWHAVEPRSVKDFGDISMVAGCTVRGRVEDTTGQPIANASLDVDQYDTPARRAETGIHARRYCHAQSQADGAFLFDRMMSPGQWSLRVSNETVVRPDPMVVPPNTPEWSMTVVVRGRTESPDIRGDVVDEAGVPVRGARLGTEPPGRGYSATMSRRDGVFELRQAKGAPPTVKLRVEREGYEVQVTEKEYAWGTQGVRVTLRAGLDVEVLVTDADTGKPIESYGVIAHPDPAHWRRISSRDGRRRARGEHAGGLATLRGLRRGPYLFLVDPDGDTWRNSGFRNFQVADAGPRRLEVQLSRGISRVVTVQTSRGSPLAGSHVELLEPIGDERVDFTTTCVHPNRSASMSSKHCAQLWAEADTDEAGRATVCAPPGARYVLRIRGPVHQPHIERGVELRKGLGPLVVRVAAGATVTGRVRPAKLVEQLLGPLSTGSSAKPGFRLYRQIADRSEQHPADDSARFLLDKDGKYTITGIPRGSWTMYLCWNLNGRDKVAQLDALEEGATRVVDLSLDGLVFAEVRGQVTHEGEPAARSTLTLKNDGGATGMYRWENLSLDAEGRFHGYLVPDTYKVLLQLRTGRRRFVMLPHETTWQLAPGEQATRDFAFRSRLAKLRIVGADGKPRAGVKVRADDPTRSWTAWFEPTDARGACELRVPHGVIHLSVWPKALSDPKGQQEFFVKHKDDPGAWDRQRIGVGVVAAGTEPQRVELPVSAGY